MPFILLIDTNLKYLCTNLLVMNTNNNPKKRVFTKKDESAPKDKKPVTARDKRKYIDFKIRVKKGDPLPSFNENEIRLNKFLANAGICSRRDADVLIQTGIVTVNGKIVTELGYKIKPEDVVHYDGATINAESKTICFTKQTKRIHNDIR